MTSELKEKKTEDVRILTPEIKLHGILTVPSEPEGIIIFAHASGNSNSSPRNQYVAEKLNKAGFATLLMDLLTETEEKVDMVTAKLRLDIPLLAGRVDEATMWVKRNPSTAKLPIGYFGASNAAAAALVAAAHQQESIGAVVCQGGRPHLARQVLPAVMAPTLFVVGGNDPELLKMNEEAAREMTVKNNVVVITGASHLFEEPGKLDQVAGYARRWFLEYIAKKHS